MNRKFWITLILYSCVCCLSFNSIIAQNPQLYFRHYTPDDGLPSSEVYDIIQDREGYIWISTDNGVSRFNGYEFENFGPQHGLTKNVVLHIQEDVKGRIWMSTLGGKFFIFSNDTIVPYKYNHKIQRGAKDEYIFYIDNELVLHISILGIGIQKINQKGKSTLLSEELTGHLNILFHESKYITNALDFDRLKRHEESEEYLEMENLGNDKIAFYSDLQKKELIINTPMKKNTSRRELPSILIDEENFYMTYGGKIFYFDQLEPKWEFSFPIFNVDFDAFKMTSTLKVIIGGDKNEGLFVFENKDNLKNANYSSQMLKGNHVGHFLEDRDGGWWVATNENGIFYNPSSENRTLDLESNLSTNYVNTVSASSNSSIYFGLNNGDIYYYDKHDNFLKKINKHPIKQKEIYDIIYDDVSQSVIISGYNSLFELKDGNFFFFKAKSRFNDIYKYRMGVKKLRLNNNTNSIFFVLLMEWKYLIEQND